MPRPKKTVPTYSRHKPTNQAYVRLPDGSGGRRTVYLGPHGSPASKAEYERVLATIRVTTTPASHATAVPADPGLTVAEVLLAFLRHAQTHYRRPDGTATKELGEYRYAFRPVRELFGHTPVREFGPLALKAVRQRMVEAGLCRALVNKRVGRVKRAVKWAASEQLVPASVVAELATVGGLQRGRTDARERDPVRPAPADDVAKALAVMVPTVRAMCQLQLLAGLRPEAVRTIRPGDIDTTGPLWVYRPADHKMTWKGRELAVPLGPRARAVLEPFLRRCRPGECVFSPVAAKDELAALRRANRRCPVYPSSPPVGTRRKPPAELRKKTRPRFTDHGYAARVRRACKKAGVPPWHPNQLRHAFATEVRRRYGLEAAQVLLGHDRADVTQVYAERDHGLAARVASEIG